jgi:hypothetical protein
MATFQRMLAAWVYGLIAAAVGGSCTALSAYNGCALLHAMSPDVPLLTFAQLKAVAVSGGFWCAVGYLKKSPLPTFYELPNDEKPNEKKSD